MLSWHSSYQSGHIANISDCLSTYFSRACPQDDVSSTRQTPSSAFAHGLSKRHLFIKARSQTSQTSPRTTKSRSRISQTSPRARASTSMASSSPVEASCAEPSSATNARAKSRASSNARCTRSVNCWSRSCAWRFRARRPEWTRPAESVLSLNGRRT